MQETKVILTFKPQVVRDTCPQKTKEGEERKPLLGMPWDRARVTLHSGCFSRSFLVLLGLGFTALNCFSAALSKPQGRA